VTAGPSRFADGRSTQVGTPAPPTDVSVQAPLAPDERHRDVLDERHAGALEALVDRHADRHVGLAVGLLQDGRAFCFMRGRIHRDRPEPPTSDTLFEIGSITKTFTATALALLALRGEVTLDDPLQRHLPAGVKIPIRGRPITLCHLATHTSGLPGSHPGMLRHYLRHRADPYADITRDDLLAALGRTRLRSEPGQRWRYSNFGVALLGDAVQTSTGASYEELIRDGICGPLGMDDTVVTVDPEREPRFAQGHDRRGRPVPHWHLPAFAAAGALRSTVADMLVYLRAELAAGRAPSAGDGESPGPAVADPATAAAGPGPAVADPAAAAAGLPVCLGAAMRLTHESRFRDRRLAMGLGWILLPDKDHRWPLVFHNGGTGGFRSFVGFVPQSRTAVVVLANDNRSVDRLGIRLSRALQQSAGA